MTGVFAPRFIGPTLRAGVGQFAGAPTPVSKGTSPSSVEGHERQLLVISYDIPPDRDWQPDCWLPPSIVSGTNRTFRGSYRGSGEPIGGAMGVRASRPPKPIGRNAM